MFVTAFLEDDDVNVIVVDWSPRSLQDYVTAKLAVAIVGRVIGLFINWLASVGTPYSKIHCVGFSLGAHAMGIAGRTTGSQIGRITGSFLESGRTTALAVSQYF